MAAVTVHRSTKGADFMALVTIVNQISTKVAILLTKLDNDVGVTDTNYASTVGAPDTLTLNH